MALYKDVESVLLSVPSTPLTVSDEYRVGYEAAWYDFRRMVSDSPTMPEKPEFDFKGFMDALDLWEKVNERWAGVCRMGLPMLRCVIDGDVTKRNKPDAFNDAMKAYLDGKTDLQVCGVKIVLNNYYGTHYSFHDCAEPKLKGDIKQGGGVLDY